MFGFARAAISKIELAPENVKALKRNLKLNDNFLRDMIIEDSVKVKA